MTACVTSGSAAPPLSLPDDLQNPSDLALFFRDVPVVGLNSRIRRSLLRQLKDRGDIDFEACWRDAELRKIAREVAVLIRDYCHWPGVNFVPEDPVDLLMSESMAGMQSVCLKLAVGKRYRVCERCLATAPETTFRDFVDRIRRASTG